MPTVHFLGRVLPKTVNISIDHDPIIKWESPDIDLNMEFICHVRDSSINVECRLSRWEADLFSEVYKRAFDLSRASIDLVGFAMGYGLSVYLDAFVNPEGIQSELLFKDDSLPAICTAFGLDHDFDEVHIIVLQEPSLYMALNDLMAAITLPHVSVVNCARAVERIKHLLAPNAQSDKQAWAAMRAELLIDEAYLRYVTDSSKDARHGKYIFVPGAITSEVTRRAWACVNRYLEYRKGGSTLPADTPILST
jgi:hypothetical protein